MPILLPTFRFIHANAKNVEPLGIHGCWHKLGLAAIAFCIGSRGFTSPVTTEHGANASNCAKNLNIIFEAVQAFRRSHDGRLPSYLSELYPDYISNPSVLACPLAKTSGNYQLGEDFRESLKYDGMTNYSFEFTSEEEKSWRIPDTKLGTKAEYKQLQMKSPVGGLVPMARCLRHREDFPTDIHKSSINLAYNGSVYFSHRFWESSVRDLMPHPYLMPDFVFSDTRPIPARVPPRSIQASDDSVDLTHYMNATMLDSWSKPFGNSDLKEFASQLQKNDWVFQVNDFSFDCRGIIQLDGKMTFDGKLGFTSPLFPDQVKGITINQTGSHLHALVGILFKADPRATVATIRLSLSDGTTFDCALNYGENIVEWTFLKDQNPTDGHSATVAWTGSNQDAELTGKKLRICLASFALPKDTTILSADFVSGMQLSPPFLLGLTIKP